MHFFLFFLYFPPLPLFVYLLIHFLTFASGMASVLGTRLWNSVKFFTGKLAAALCAGCLSLHHTHPVLLPPSHLQHLHAPFCSRSRAVSPETNNIRKVKSGVQLYTCPHPSRPYLQHLLCCYRIRVGPESVSKISGLSSYFWV